MADEKEKKEEAKIDDSIYEIKQYVKEWRQVFEKNDIKTGKKIYEGTNVLTLRNQDGHPVTNIPFNFFIEANSIEDAFEKFDDLHKEVADKKKKEVMAHIQRQQSKLAIPPRGGNLLGGGNLFDGNNGGRIIH